MLNKPVYNEDVIVLVKINYEWMWFVSEKTMWVMDYDRWIKSFGQELHLPPERDGTGILTKSNWGEFQNMNAKFMVTINDLRELIIANLPIDSWEESSELFPSLFLDFDDSILYSTYPEYPLFDKYAPLDWIGKYEEFYELIPATLKYWVIDGVDYMPME